MLALTNRGQSHKFWLTEVMCDFFALRLKVLTCKNTIFLKSHFCLGILIFSLATPLLSPSVFAANVHIFVADNSDHYLHVAKNLRNHFVQQYPLLTVGQSTTNNPPATPLAADTLIITIGTSAAAVAISRHPASPQISLFITQQSWENYSIANEGVNQKAAIFMDQPVERYVWLAQLLMPEANNLSSVFGKISRNQQNILAEESQDHKLQLISADITRTSNPLQVLSPLFSQSDIFIALPDEAFIWKGRTVRPRKG